MTSAGRYFATVPLMALRKSAGIDLRAGLGGRCASRDGDTPRIPPNLIFTTEPSARRMSLLPAVFRQVGGAVAVRLSMRRTATTSDETSSPPSKVTERKKRSNRS